LNINSKDYVKITTLLNFNWWIYSWSWRALGVLGQKHNQKEKSRH